MDDVSKAKAQLYQARTVRQERAAAFWQRTIEAGRQAQPREAWQSRDQDKPRQPRPPRAR